MPNQEYCKLLRSPVVDRVYRNYMKRIVELALVMAEEYGRWKIYEIVV
jgi:hypothetical protein